MEQGKPRHPLNDCLRSVTKGRENNGESEKCEVPPGERETRFLTSAATPPATQALTVRQIDVAAMTWLLYNPLTYIKE